MNSMENQMLARKAKVIFIGNSTVGKTSLISSIRQSEFNQFHEPTVGIDFFSKVVTKNGAFYKLQFWDTAGQQRFRCIIPAYLRSAKIGIAVYDITQKESFDGISTWIDTFKQYAPENSKIILVGNKNDIKNERDVTTEEIQQLLKVQGVKHFEVSAKTREGVQSLIEQILNYIAEDKNDDIDFVSRHHFDFQEKAKNKFSLKKMGQNWSAINNCCQL